MTFHDILYLYLLRLHVGLLRILWRVDEAVGVLSLEVLLLTQHRKFDLLIVDHFYVMWLLFFMMIILLIIVFLFFIVQSEYVI